AFLPRLDATKKFVESDSDTLQDILNDLRMNAGKVWSVFFDLGQLPALIKTGNRNSIDFIGVSSLLKRGVVQFAADRQPRLEVGDGLGRWFEFVLERFHHNAICMYGLNRQGFGRPLTRFVVYV